MEKNIKPISVNRSNFAEFGDLISTSDINSIDINEGYAKRFDNLADLNTLKNGLQIMKDRIYLFDTTLRDGQQTTGVNFTVSDKVTLSRALDELGIDYIEGGWPGANPIDSQFFERKLEFNNSCLTAFGMTRRAGHSSANDPGLNTLLNTNTSAVCIFGRCLFSSDHFL